MTFRRDPSGKLLLPASYAMSRRALLKKMGMATTGLAAASFLAACGDSNEAPAGGESGGGSQPAAADPTATQGGSSGASTTPQTRLGIDSDQDLEVDVSQWSPEYIREIAGTLEVDTAADCAAIVPLDHSAELDYWDVGPTEASPEIDHEMWEAYFEAWNETYPNIPRIPGDNVQNLTYADMIDQIRTAAFGSSAPDVARMTLLWGCEFAGRGQLAEVDLAEFGFSEDDFWPGALQSCRWQGKLYGVPTNNETMALIWNRKIFEDAGLDPDTPPATWEEVRAFSKQIKDETGINGYGMVARVNHGNTPYRFMPVVWAYGGGALDEANTNAEYQDVWINNEGSVEALQLHYDMYVTDQSVPIGALTNDNTVNADLFFGGQLGMMISHPSEYASMVDRAAQATGADKEKAQEVVDNMVYGLIPEGPERRAVVFGGWNMHIFSDEAVGHTVDRDAARAIIAFHCGPEWSVKRHWGGSNPGNLNGFRTTWMKERLDTIRFLDVTTSMLPYGIPFPVIPESTEIMNIIIPEMLQNALTESMTVQEAADDAAEKIKAALSGGQY